MRSSRGMTIYTRCRNPDSSGKEFRARHREKDGEWLGEMNQALFDVRSGVIILAALLFSIIVLNSISENI
jgi:hypothetical protein